MWFGRSRNRRRPLLTDGILCVLKEMKDFIDKIYIKILHQQDIRKRTWFQGRQQGRRPAADLLQIVFFPSRGGLWLGASWGDLHHSRGKDRVSSLKNTFTPQQARLKVTEY